MPTIYNPNKRKGLFFIPSGAIKSESAAFSYSQASYRVDESNPTPTITGETGGTFTSTPEGLTLNSSTGEITLSSSVVNSYVVTYTLPSGTFESRSLGIEAAAFASTQSFEFNGFDSYFEINSPILNSAGDMTVSAWVKFNDTTSLQGIFESANYYTTGFNGGFGLRANGVGLSAAFSNGTSFVYNIEPAGFTIGKWFHVAFTFNNTSKLGTYYIDGSSIGTHTFNSAYDNADLVNGAELGRVVKNSAYTLNGYLDEVAIWNSALSSAAVTEIWNSGVPNDLDELTNASDPTVWYRMGE